MRSKHRYINKFKDEIDLSHILLLMGKLSRNNPKPAKVKIAEISKRKPSIKDSNIIVAERLEK